MRALALALVIAALIVITQCGGPSPTSPVTGGIKGDPSFSTDIQAIISNAGCAGASCHDGITIQAGLRLLPDSSYGYLVNVASTEVLSKMIVAPGDLANSYLIDKLEGTATVGVQMPATGQALSAGNITMIKNWIIKGAKNN
jgi:hypothetical protein